MLTALNNKLGKLAPPTFKGSYTDEDCIFVLKDIGNAIQEEGNEDREDKMDGGVHYSEMLPIEHYPSSSYLSLYYESMQTSASIMAEHVASVAEMILADKGDNVVLVSLARAGTPIGVLIRRYLKHKYGMDVPHYSISIIRGKGIDVNAVLYVVQNHPNSKLQFVDGWTGKGTINKVLELSISEINKEYGLHLDSDLAVLADPAHAAPIFGTRDDFFLPSSCLNSVVSGLASRTVHRDDLTGENEYHGAKYYEQWKSADLSLNFVDTISKYFPYVKVDQRKRCETTNQGWSEVERIKEEFGINSINKIKPGIGETTRVLLRRVPWKVLVKNMDTPELKHILMLAKEKDVPVEVYEKMSYACIGMIKE